MRETYLAHHGILGQKWGVRRYQNADGSLTSAGKARYNNDGTKKKAKDMTDEELRSANNRLNAERQYNELTRSNSVKIGASIVGSMAAVAVSEIVTNGKLGKSSVAKMLGAGTLAGITVGTLMSGGQVTGIGKKK